MLKPEEKARQQIDRQLEQAGWLLESPSEMNIFAGLGVAVREFSLKSGHADYMLYLDGKAAGVIEAKPEGHSLTGAEIQSAKYTDGLPSNVPHYHLPMPFAYESTGTVTQFTNSLDPDARSQKPAYRGIGTQGTILLKRIRDPQGTVVADHLWLNGTKAFQAIELNVGSVLASEARITRCLKGLRGEKQIDFKLSRPTKVKLLARGVPSEE